MLVGALNSGPMSFFQTNQQCSSSPQNNDMFGGRKGNDTTIAILLQLQSTPKSNGVGAMSVKETVGLYFLFHRVTMNGSKCLNVLNKKLGLHINIHQCDTFMHNAALCHRSKLVSSFLQENQVKVLDWPGNSPDLSPKENL